MGKIKNGSKNANEDPFFGDLDSKKVDWGAVVHNFVQLNLRTKKKNRKIGLV